MAQEYTRNRDLSILFSSFVVLYGMRPNFCACLTNSRIQEDLTLPLSAKKRAFSKADVERTFYPSFIPAAF